MASHLGGITDPLIVSWPAKIRDKGAVRGQFHHVVDIVPTIYEVAGIEAPEMVNGVKQTPLEGASLAYSFDHPQAPSPRNLQYFEKAGNRGIYKDGWFAGRRFLLPWGPQPAKWESNIDQHPWELYNLNEDYSQAHNLADKYPAKLAELVKAFDREARRNNVYPIAPYRLPQPSPAAGRTSFTYRDGVTRLPSAGGARSLGPLAHLHRRYRDPGQRGRGRDLRRRRTPRRLQPLPQGRQGGVRAQHLGQDA